MFSLKANKSEELQGDRMSGERLVQALSNRAQVFGEAVQAVESATHQIQHIERQQQWRFNEQIKVFGQAGESDADRCVQEESTRRGHASLLLLESAGSHTASSKRETQNERRRCV